MNSNNFTAADLKTIVDTTTAESIFRLVIVPTGVYAIFAVLCFLLFGLFVYKGYSNDLAPRCANRSPTILKNALLYNNNTNTNPMTAKFFLPILWMYWGYKLTYKQCLIDGIPGTGTITGNNNNNNGNNLLKMTNLDNIILLKFHTLLLKISVLVAFLCTFIILPIYCTASCDPLLLGEGTCKHVSQYDIGFSQTTISHIPNKIYNNDTNLTMKTYISSKVLSDYILHKEDSIDLLANNGTVLTDENNAVFHHLFRYIPDQSIRIIVIMLCCLIIYSYTFYLLTNEWINNIALRRLFFLEADHYTKRMTELAIMNINDNGNDNNSDDNNETALPTSFIYRPSLTHPDITETPPPIGLYSIIIQLPHDSTITVVNSSSSDNSSNDEESSSSCIKRQLIAASMFLDEIIPPSLGFSSSVVAVTVLPKASSVANTWMKWYDFMKKVHTLIYIRNLINDKQQQQQKQKQNHSKENGNGNESEINDSTDNTITFVSSNTLTSKQLQSQEEIKMNTIALDNGGHNETNSTSATTATATATKEFMYNDFNVLKYAKSLGYIHKEVDIIAEFIDGMGVEEFNIFAINYARKAGGLSLTRKKKKYDRYDIEELEESEDAIKKELKISCSNLVEARNNAVIKEDNNNNNNDDDVDVELLVDSGNEAPVQPVHHSFVNKFNDNDDDDDPNGRGDEYLYENGRLSFLHPNNDDLPAISTCRRRQPSVMHNSTRRGRRGSIWFTGDQLDLAIRKLDTMQSNSSINESQAKIQAEGSYCCFNRTIRGTKPDVDAVVDPKYNNDTDNVNMIDDEGLQNNDFIKEGRAFLTDHLHPSYAVATFTSRYAASIARQCLVDGGGTSAWRKVDAIPIYPLADSPPNMYFPSGILRPVSPTISYTSKRIRRWIVYLVLIIFSFVWTWPIDKINNLILDPALLAKVLGISYNTAVRYMATFSGLGQSLLFSVCPTIFKFLSCIEGSSASMEQAEQKAMIYFWYFYIVARFMGPVLLNAAQSYHENEEGTLEETFMNTMVKLTSEIPKSLGPAALTYIIFSALINWPAFYLLQSGNFITKLLGMDWLNNYILKGGGIGRDVPYRIYVDSGYIFACLISMAPMVPLLGPFCLLHFLIVSPILRWLLVFTYRPKFDSGGDKWPKLHHIIISSLLLGQFFTGFSFLLKGNITEGMVIGFCIIPTLIYNNIILSMFLRTYRDGGLLQTARVHYGRRRSSRSISSHMKREEFRRWLVDCHKASYVPTCLSGGHKNLVTTEPATTVATAEEMNIENARRD